MTLDEYIQTLPPEYWYDPEVDLWINPRDPAEWVIGANAFVTRYGQFVIFYPKAAGTVVQANESLGVMETWKTAFGIQSPVNCTITQGNESVATDVSLARQDPYGAGWLFRVRPSLPSDRPIGLLDHAGYVAWLTKYGEQQFASLRPQQDLTPYDPLAGI
jgi:glycine cleavage system H protein